MFKKWIREEVLKERNDVYTFGEYSSLNVLLMKPTSDSFLLEMMSGWDPRK